MSPDILKKMRDMGLTLDQAIELIEAMASKEPTAAARRQKQYRERQRAARDATSDITRDVTDDATGVTPPPLPLPSSPQTPQQPTPTPPDINTRARGGSTKPNGFARFWEAYPNKVAKPKAEKAYAKAIATIGGPDPPGALLAGVERAKASREWLEGYIPHPATWLNQGRWEDQPAEIIPIAGRRHERPDHNAKLDAKNENFGRSVRAADAIAGLGWEP